MKLLALEAGGPVLSAALFENSRAVGQAWLRAPQRPTEQLAPLVDTLLRRHHWRPAQVRAVACGNGPGSFTGLRSSMAFGAGWALASEGLLLVPVPTLRAWAEAFCPPQERQALVLLDGRRSQVYRGLLHREAGGWADVVKPALMDLAAALGEPRAVQEAALISDLGYLSPEAEPLNLDSAALALAVGRLACRTLQAGGTPAPWEPEYLRRSEAELLWERLHPAPGAVGAA
jgi:tRNA threonylcarbamoyladenosine biosynthesis protein TsaB